MKKIISIILCICTVFVFSAVAFAETTPNYVLLGDSIAQGYGVYNRDKASYGKIVADTNGYNYFNYGVDGHRSIDLLGRLDEAEVADSVANADIISISVGGNDYLQQNLPKIAVQVMQNNYKTLDDIKAIFAENFDAIICRIRSLNPDAVILVQTLFNPRYDLLRSLYGLATERVNDVIYTYLDENPGAYYIVDTIPVMEGHPEYIAVDSVHPSAVGNVELAKLVLKTMNEIGISENTEPVINSIGIDEIPFSSYIFKAVIDFFARCKEIMGSIFVK